MKLTIDHVSRRYEGKTVLSDCTYDFPETGTHILMGPNGCGKSTLLRICALLEAPDAGSVVYSAGGAPLACDISLRRRITLVLPRTGVFNTTVFGNVAYGLRIRRAGQEEIEEKVGKALAYVGLEHKEEQHARTLSSGETQRLGIARAIVLDPEVLFLDEPTASVDEENTEIIESIILAMKREQRTLVLMTTHDRDQAERLADGILVLRLGRLAERIMRT